MMLYASIAVDKPIGKLDLFTYSVPDGVAVLPGDLVIVPFGSTVKQGIVWKTTGDLPPDVTSAQIKPIDQVVEPSELVNLTQLELAEWIARFYRVSKYDACRLMLPRGSGNLAVNQIWRADLSPDQKAELSDQEQKLIDLVPPGKTAGISRAKLMRAGGAKSKKIIDGLIKKGVLQSGYVIETPKLSKGKIKAAKLAMATNDALVLANASTNRTKKTRIALIDHLTKSDHAETNAELKKRFSSGAIHWAVKNGIVRFEEAERTDNLPGKQISQIEFEHSLSKEQKVAFEAVRQSLLSNSRENPQIPFLLFGETGSGKTEVYLQAIKTCLEMGRGAIMLLPEISLTPQMMERVNSRFPGNVALLHSQLTQSQLVHQWRLIREGQLRVVLGARSALFAPISNLGIIIIDEEHEWTYKSSEQVPYYNTRTVAERLVRITGATLLLGSATPDVVSFRRAERKTYQLLTLTGSSFQAQHGVKHKLKVDLVDMRAEVRRGKYGILSQCLQDAIGETLDNGEKAIIFHNRLGLSSLLQCMECGAVQLCRFCDTNLVLHSAKNKQPPVLRCHYCGYSTAAQDKCTMCNSGRQRKSIPGVQSVENEMNRLFKNAVIVRWDSTTATGYKQHLQIAETIRTGRANILLGTQMVSKGLDLHNITLAAVVSADSILSIPDFRSEERLFQAITQLIGRAGRGTRKARAIIQSFIPDHYAVQTASEQNYRAFYGHTIDIRARHRLPPFGRFVRLVYSAYSYEKVWDITKKYAAQLRAQIARDGSSDTQVMGPSPIYPLRVRNSYRMQLVVKGNNPMQVLDRVGLPMLNWKIDIDPINLV